MVGIAVGVFYLGRAAEGVSAARCVWLVLVLGGLEAVGEIYA